MAAFIADRIVRCHLRTMARLNVDYDLLTWEGDILRLHFWATAFEDLKQRGSVFLADRGTAEGLLGDAHRGRRRHARRRRRRPATTPSSGRRSSSDRTAR